MYTQALNTKDMAGGGDDPVREARFQARVDAEEKIEPNDWMPEAYRRTLIRQIAQHAHSEIVGMLPEGNWITRAPTLRARRRCSPRCRTRAATALYLYAAAETLGVSREELVEQLLDGKQKYSSIFNYPTLTWADIGVDRLAGRRRRDHEPDPALPLLLRSLCARDDPHLQGGELPPAPGLRDHGHALPRGTPEQKAMAQDALNRWWWPVLMMFGPSDKDSQHTDKSMRWKIKRFTNDELRQKFVDATVPQGHYLGLTFPDPELKFNEDDRALGVRRDRLGRVQARGRGRRPVQPPAHEAAARGARERRLGARGGARAMRRSARRARSALPAWPRNDAEKDHDRKEHGRCGKCSSAAAPGWRTAMSARVHAVDAEMALQDARDVYTRRGEGLSIWVVPSAAITASDPADKDMMFEPTASKIYRHPTFYDVPDEVGHM